MSLSPKRTFNQATPNKQLYYSLIYHFKNKEFVDSLTFDEMSAMIYLRSVDIGGE